MERTAIFLDLLRDTADLIAKRFPKDRDIDYHVHQVETAIRMSARLTIVHFLEGVQPYREQIAKRDEAFFLGMAKSDDTLQAFNLGDKYNQLSDSDKDTLWANITKLIKLGDRIVDGS